MSKSERRRDRGKLGLHDAAHAHEDLVDVGAPVGGQAVRREQPVHQRLQPIRLADDHLRVLDQLRPVELALEQLRRAADAAQRILDLVRETADQLAIGLLLLEQALLARDLELLVDVAELEQQRCVAVLDRRHRAGEVELALADDAELDLLLGIRRAADDRLLDRREQRRAFAEDLRAACGRGTSCRESSNRFSAAGFT